MEESNLEVRKLIAFYQEEIAELTSEKIVLKTQLAMVREELEEIKGTSK